MVKKEVKKQTLLKEESIPNIISNLIKKSNIKLSKYDNYYPTNENGNEKITNFIKLLEDNNFKRIKPKGYADEYTYDYIKDNIIVRISYRAGKGYQAILKITKE